MTYQFLRIPFFLSLLFPLLLQAQPIDIETAEQWEMHVENLMEVGKIDSALIIQQQILEVYQDAESWEAFVAGSSQLGFYYFLAGKEGNIFTPLNKAIHILSQQADESQQWLAYAYMEKVNIFSNFSEWDSSLVNTQKAIELYSQLELGEDLLFCHISKASNYAQLGLWSRMRADLDKAKELARELLSENALSWGEIYNLYGVMESQLRNYEEALAYKLRAIQYRQDSLVYAQNLNNLAEAYELRADWARAIQYYEMGLNILQKYSDSDPAEIQNILNNLCGIWTRKGEAEKAIDYGTQSLELLNQLDVPDFAQRLINANNNLAQAYLVSSQSDEALEVLKISQEIHKEEIYNKRRTSHNLSHVYRALGNYPEAIRYMQASISEYEEMGEPDHPIMAKKYRHLGTMFAIQGEHQTALEHYNLAFTLPKGKISRLDSLKILRDKGLSLIALSKYSSVSQVDSALSNYLEAIALSNRLRRDNLEGSAALFEQDTFPVFERAADAAYMLYQQENDPRFLEKLFHISEESRRAQDEEKALAELRLHISRLPNPQKQRFGELEVSLIFYKKLLENEQTKTPEVDREKVASWENKIEKLTEENSALMNLLPEMPLGEMLPGKRSEMRSLAELQAYLSPEIMLGLVLEGEKKDFLLAIHSLGINMSVIDKNFSRNSALSSSLTDMLARVSDKKIKELFLYASEETHIGELNKAFPSMQIRPFEVSPLAAWLNGKE